MSSETEAVIPSQGYLVVDHFKCSGCMSCMFACTLAHHGTIQPSYARIQIKKNVFGTYPDDDMEQFICWQCEDPACLKACPTGAIYAHPETGVRMVNEEECTGCKACIKACPRTPSRMTFNFEDKVALKCDLCTNTPYWDQQGGVDGKQACVEACSMRALKMVNRMPEQTDEGYRVNLRNLHYARAAYPIDDAGMQPPREAVMEAGLQPSMMPTTDSMYGSYQREECDSEGDE